MPELRSALGRLRRLLNLVRRGGEHAVPELVFELAAGVVARWKDAVTPSQPPAQAGATEAPAPPVAPVTASPIGTTVDERTVPTAQAPSPTEEACAWPGHDSHDATAP